MSTPAWRVFSWKPVSVTPRQWMHSVRSMRHVSSSLELDDELDGLRHGQVVWATDVGDVPLGIAWEWREVKAGVVALADPMTVISNVELLSNDGERMLPSERILTLNAAVYRLPWLNPHGGSEAAKPVQAVAEENTFTRGPQPIQALVAVAT